jgi:hypothetical protein
MSKQQPIIIEQHAHGTGGSGNSPQGLLKTRRFSIAAVLALVEFLYIAIWHSGWIVAALVAVLLLVAAVAGIRRVRNGVARDALIVIAIAQGLALIPIAIIASFALVIVLAVFAMIGVVVAAFRMRA